MLRVLISRLAVKATAPETEKEERTDTEQRENNVKIYTNIEPKKVG